MQTDAACNVCCFALHSFYTVIITTLHKLKFCSNPEPLKHTPSYSHRFGKTVEVTLQAHAERVPPLKVIWTRQADTLMLKSRMMARKFAKMELSSRHCISRAPKMSVRDTTPTCTCVLLNMTPNRTPHHTSIIWWENDFQQFSAEMDTLLVFLNCQFNVATFQPRLRLSLSSKEHSVIEYTHTSLCVPFTGPGSPEPNGHRTAASYQQ